MIEFTLGRIIALVVLIVVAGSGLFYLNSLTRTGFFALQICSSKEAYYCSTEEACPGEWVDSENSCCSTACIGLISDSEYAEIKQQWFDGEIDLQAFIEKSRAWKGRQ